jgi:hypothetical protein
MFINELERLKTSGKRFISINTFFSTSCNRQLALTYAGADNIDPEKVPILFDIQANTRLQGAKPFANIESSGGIRIKISKFCFIFARSRS